jgi:hypothetical protein
MDEPVAGPAGYIATEQAVLGAQTLPVPFEPLSQPVGAIVAMV